MTQVSVLMSVYNDAAFVEEAVRSVLAQTFTDFELLVIDDGSKDGSAEIVAGIRDPRLRLLRNETNMGLARSLNRGLAEARGALIARHDSDDGSLPQRLEKQVAAFVADPSLALLGTQVQAVNMRGRRVRGSDMWRKCRTPLAIEWQLMFESPFVHSTVMFRRDVVLGELGGYDDRFRTNQMCEDYELWSRIVSRHRAANLDEALLVLRCRSGSVSRGYEVEALQRFGDLALENRSRSLQQRCEWDDALRILLAASNPSVCAPLHDIAPVIASMRAMLARFEEVHPEAVAIPEIRQHAASCLVRLANLMAPQAPGAAFRALAAAREFDRSGLLGSALLVGARAVLGSTTGRGRATGTAQLR